jgi:DNA-binding transcriptional regulator YdaS (Cro superfamily)
MADVAVDVPSSSSRPGSAQQQAHHQLPASLSMGATSKIPKGPLGIPLMSSSPSQMDIMAKFESGYRSASPVRMGNGVPSPQSIHRPVNFPLQEFVKRIEGKIRQRSEATRSALDKKPVLRRGKVTATVDAPTSATTERGPSPPISAGISPTPMLGRSSLSRPASRQHQHRASSPSESRSASAMNRSRIASPMSEMTMDLLPPPPLWDHELDGRTAPSSSYATQRRGPRLTAPPASSTSIQQWVDARQSVLSEVAIAISPVTSGKHSAAPRTLANSAIRWRGIRAASALARAFEVARTQEELLSDGNIRLPQRLM